MLIKFDLLGGDWGSSESDTNLSASLFGSPLISHTLTKVARLDGGKMNSLRFNSSCFIAGGKCASSIGIDMTWMKHATVNEEKRGDSYI